MNISSWAGCCRTRKSTKITRKHRLQFLGRMLQRQKRQKSPSFIVKTPVKSIAEHRKVRELPRKMNIEEVEEAKKYENLQTKPVLDPFKSTAPHRKVRELPRKMNIEEVEEPETMKIYRQNPCASVAATRKLRKFTDETNMQARNHENSDEFRPTPLRHLDLNTPAFYYYRKNPKCYHTVWGKTPFHDAIRLPLAAPNHHAIRFFSADTFEPGGAVCFNERGGNPPPKPVVRWLKVVPMENHKVLTLSTSTISTDHKNVMSRS